MLALGACDKTKNRDYRLWFILLLLLNCVNKFELEMKLTGILSKNQTWHQILYLIA